MLGELPRALAGCGAGTRGVPSARGLGDFSEAAAGLSEWSAAARVGASEWSSPTFRGRTYIIAAVGSVEELFGLEFCSVVQ